MTKMILMRPSRTAAMSFALLSTAVALSGCSGMAGLQDLHYSCVNKSRASAAWHDRYDAEQRRCLGNDYESGFKAGYFDSATGKDCGIPPTPPPKYWSTRYQCCDGQTAIQNWFKGYQCGVAAAESAGFPEFHEIPVSAVAPTLNKTGCGTCYSPDRCECNAAPAIPSTAAPFDWSENYGVPEQASYAPVKVGLIGPINLDPPQYEVQTASTTSK